jgi:cob(I)alamin adenosyltransferase
MSDEVSNLVKDRADKLDAKLETIASDIVEIKITSAKHNEALIYHIKRSDLNEENIEMLRKEFEPIKAHVAATNGVLKFIAVCSSIFGIIFGFLKLFKK